VVVIALAHTWMARLSWPGWLFYRLTGTWVSRQFSCRWSAISVLMQFSIECFWCGHHWYCSTRLPTFGMNVKGHFLG